MLGVRCFFLGGELRLRGWGGFVCEGGVEGWVCDI